MLEPALLATDSAVLHKKHGIWEWGLYPLTERGARGSERTGSGGVKRRKDELVAVMEGSMVCGGDRAERAGVIMRMHNEHPEGWNPFLIELESSEKGWQLWQGGFSAVGEIPEVGGHVSNDGWETGYEQNAALFTNGETYPEKLRVLRRVTKTTAWSELDKLEVLVGYGSWYWEAWEKRKGKVVHA